jgi:hypothetical protein
MPEHTQLRVSCHAGHRGEETPRKFFLGDREVEVIEVLDRWIAPDHRYFKCLGSDDSVYILRHDVVDERWELTLFAPGSGPRDWGIPDPKKHH